MKKQHVKLSIRILVLCFVAFNTATVKAQFNNIKANYISPMKVGLTYERAINSKHSLGLNYIHFDVYYGGFKFFSADYYRNKGNRFGLEYRYYLLNEEKTLNGLYIGASMAYGKHHVKYRDVDYTVESGGFFPNITSTENVGEVDLNVLATGLKVGYQKRFKRFNFDIGAGFSSNRVLNGIEEILLNTGRTVPLKKDVEGISPELFLGLGFAF